MKARYLVLTIAIIVVTMLSLNSYVFSQVAGKSKVGAGGMSMKQGSAGLGEEAGEAGGAAVGEEKITASAGADELILAPGEIGYPELAEEEAVTTTEDEE